MNKPTDEQLHDYARSLPKIYKYALEALGKALPNRRRGEDVDVLTIEQWVTLQDDYFTRNDVLKALDQLSRKGFIDETNVLDPDFPSYTPTEIGERLIEIITGVATPIAVPELPEPEWAR